MTTKFSAAGTTEWQADYVHAHLDELAGYLVTVSASTLMQHVAENTHALLNLKPGEKVLEVGCGNGMFLPGLAEKVFPAGRVVGVDHADAFVTEARKNAAASRHGTIISIESGDAYKLPFGDGTFDAAHCERVLMHLDDPTAAVREMARVVRPGGVVVAAEPDWPGMRFDHPDPEAFQLVYLRALHLMQFRQSDLGLTLFRRFSEAGLVERKFLPATAILTDIATIRMYGLKLEPAVEALIAEKPLPLERLRAVIPALEQASAAGTYYSTVIMHVMAGTVPR